MSKIDFILPKVDGKLDIKTPSRWYISDRMLAAEFAHFVDKNSHISYDRGTLISLLYDHLTAIHDLNMPTINGYITISADSSNAPYWIRKLVMHLSYDTGERCLPDITISATDTAIPSNYDVLTRLLVAAESDEFVKQLSGFMYRAQTMGG